MENNLIVVKQLPIIEDQLRQVKASVDQRVATVLALACTEETYKDVKKARAELNKEFQDLEARRREVKRSILAPYEAFEKLYKECAADAFTKADAELREKIAAVENGIKGAKRDDLIAFFNEYRASVNIPDDLVPFERAQINVTMSDSPKKLRERAAAFLENVANELRLIETLPYKDEVMVEYRKNLSAPQAALIVEERHKQMEEAARRREALKTTQAVQDAAQAKIEEVLREEAPVPVAAPIEQPIVEAPVEKTYFASFRVRGTLEKLKALKEFLVNGGYDYEQL